MNDLKQLLSDGKINKWEYDSYILFCLDELGRIYLYNRIDSLFTDCPEGMQIDHTYAVHFGRMAEWRDIKLAIVKINQLLKDVDNDRRSTDADQYFRNNTLVSTSDTIPFGERN